ncbi:aspartate-semialdehyde dehydrogenase [Pelagibacterales bacterium SAG-MED01]|nr:aspartate-semialdehyde dehydrogenase [Pelagibacterales bacterium SAG-MED01]
MDIAIVGATGNVGRKLLEVLEKKELSFDNLHLVASSKSAGKKIIFKGKEYEISNLESFDFSKVKIAFFSAGKKISEKFAEIAAKSCLVIDNSSHYRMDPDVPLIVPQVNSEALKNIKKNIVSNPNCSTAQLVIALKPLHDLYTIKRIVVSTYQSVSGGGKAPMDELINQSNKFLENYLTPESGLHNIESKNFTKQIAFNAIPQIDLFSDDGYTKEELKMTNETKKILDEKIDLSATCVRVPTLVSHAESVNIEFEKPFTLEKVNSAIESAEGCKVVDLRDDGGYVTPVEAEGRFDTFVSRIREDKTIKNGLNLWIVSDNLLRGAALNAVEIAETLIKNNFYGK